MTSAERKGAPRSAGAEVPEPEVSVVVPTFNRMDTLPEVLDGLVGQRDCPPFEVVVVDDGSEPPTRRFLDEWRRGLGTGPLGPVAVCVESQENRGPAAARNLGVERSRGRLVAFLGDDTVPSRGWLAAHVRAHAAAGRRGEDPERVGVIGYTDWHPRMRVDPFLRYINEYGLQFGYALIEDPQDVPFNFFYTSNLSVPRSALLAEPFDVEFPYAAWEDIEVSYRLKKRGFRLCYASDARVLHDHPTNLARFAERQEKAGYCAVVFYRRHPELGGFLGLGPDGPPPVDTSRVAGFRWWLVRSLQRMRVPLRLPTLWEGSLRRHYILGLHRGWRDGAGLRDAGGAGAEGGTS